MVSSLVTAWIQSCDYHDLTAATDPSRSAVLPVHVDALDFLYQQHQHPRRHQRGRGERLQPARRQVRARSRQMTRWLTGRWGRLHQVGQALVIALSVVVNDLLYFELEVGHLLGRSESKMLGFGLARGSNELVDRHLFSLYFMLPLVGVCLGLLKHNWSVSLPRHRPHTRLFQQCSCSYFPTLVFCRYPARAFVGDTFCYFAGMAFAVVGILGHFSKTLLLFFLPQIFNFVYSAPQLFGLLPCPRHRLPRLNAHSGLLEPSFAPVPPAGSAEGRKGRARVGRALVGVLGAVGLVRVRRDDKGEVVGVSNLTILNLILVRRGAMGEAALTRWMLGVQVAGSGVCFLVRYGGASWFYDASRR